MIISKVATDATRYSRACLSFKNARTAFKAFLASQQFGSGQCVLLPSYIGWSAREGSGVFDPIMELGLPYSFYRLDEQLNIDLDDLESKLNSNRTKVVVLIHYFGRVDPNGRRAAEM